MGSPYCGQLPYSPGKQTSSQRVCIEPCARKAEVVTRCAKCNLKGRFNNKRLIMWVTQRVFKWKNGGDKWRDHCTVGVLLELGCGTLFDQNCLWECSFILMVLHMSTSTAAMRQKSDNAVYPPISLDCTDPEHFKNASSLDTRRSTCACSFFAACFRQTASFMCLYCLSHGSKSSMSDQLAMAICKLYQCLRGGLG